MTVFYFKAAIYRFIWVIKLILIHGLLHFKYIVPILEVECEICGRRYKSKASLYLHRSRKHRDQLRQYSTSVKRDYDGVGPMNYDQ